MSPIDVYRQQTASPGADPLAAAATALSGAVEHSIADLPRADFDRATALLADVGE